MIGAAGSPLRRLFAAALAAGLLVDATGPAAAHRLKLFLATDAGEITGHAFFVGGGRPDGVEFIVADAAGRVVHRGRTDDHGALRWRPEVAADYAVAVDTGDGHRVTATIVADRLAGPAAVAPPTPASDTAPATTSPIDRDALARLVEAHVDAALERRLRPLMEAYDQAESRLRFNDVMGGIGMIVGLAGAAAWAASRRRGREDGRGGTS